MMPPDHLDLFVLILGVAAGIVLAATGIVKLVKLGFALKKRLEGYTDLPVRAYVTSTQRKLSAAERAFELAPLLVYRAQTALAGITESRRLLVAIVKAPSSYRKLGELLVLGGASLALRAIAARSRGN